MSDYADEVARALDGGREPLMHPNGFIQLDISEQGDRSKRLHVWSDEIEVAHGAFTIHDHSFGFRSEVLCGELIHLVWHVAVHDGLFEIWTAGDDRAEGKAKLHAKGEAGCVIEPTGWKASLGGCEVHVQRPGSIYNFEPLLFHDTIAHGLTATVMEKTQVISNAKPRVLVREGHHPDELLLSINPTEQWMREQISRAFFEIGKSLDVRQLTSNQLEKEKS